MVSVNIEIGKVKIHWVYSHIKEGNYFPQKREENYYDIYVWICSHVGRKIKKKKPRA